VSAGPNGAGPLETQPLTGARAGDTPRQVRPLLYVALVLAAVLVAYVRELRLESIYACAAYGYSADRYLANCQANRYGDYEHGAFWYPLEPEAGRFLATSQVIFLGGSRLMWAFSNEATAEWFAAASARYYLLGFSAFESYPFEEALLRQFAAKPRAYVINVDGFFNPAPSIPARYVMEDWSAWPNYQSKRLLQIVHRALCGHARALCGSGSSIYGIGGSIWRSRSTGVWSFDHTISEDIPVTDSPVIDSARLSEQITAARGFLSRLSVSSDCVILTMVPTVKTRRAEAQTLADALSMPLLLPEVAGLVTMDGSHLEHESAVRWSREFLAAAAPRLHRCLGS
jgi:hypothetical protein